MSAEIRLIIDGIIFQKDPYGGIGRLFFEILPRMCNLDSGLRVTILTDGPVRMGLPQHDHITHQKYLSVRPLLRPRGIWKSFLYPFRRLGSMLWGHLRDLWLQGSDPVKGELDDAHDPIWHSTYYTQPTSWTGYKVVTVHDLIHERYPELFTAPMDRHGRRQKEKCIQQADAVICVSEATRDDLTQFYNVLQEKIFIVHSAASEVFRVLDTNGDKLIGLPGQAFLLYVGGRSPYKNFDGLVEVFSKWAHQEEVLLVVVGGAWSQEEQQMLADLGIQRHVHLVTDADDSLLCQLYNQSTALIYPSFYEGFGIPLLEALACGCPVVASKIPSTVEVAGECPIYFNPYQPETLITALDQALVENRSPARIAVGLERVKRYSWERAAQGTLDVYRSLLYR